MQTIDGGVVVSKQPFKLNTINGRGKYFLFLTSKNLVDTIFEHPVIHGKFSSLFLQTKRRWQNIKKTYENFSQVLVWNVRNTTEFPLHRISATIQHGNAACMIGTAAVRDTGNRYLLAGLL